MYLKEDNSLSKRCPVILTGLIFIPFPINGKSLNIFLFLEIFQYKEIIITDMAGVAVF